MEGALAPAGIDSVTFYVDRDSLWGTTRDSWANRNRHLGSDSHAITVPRVDADALFKQYGVPFYLKLDIEGAEGVVLSALGAQTSRPRYLSLRIRKTELRATEKGIRDAGKAWL